MRENPQALGLRKAPIPRTIRKFLAGLSPAVKNELITGIISAASIRQRDKQDSYRVRKVAEKTIAKSTRQISSTQQHQDLTTCKICFESQIRRVTSCGHVFCTECLSEWKKSSKTCPTCRRELGRVQPLYL